jgi:hypothetical protein
VTASEPTRGERPRPGSQRRLPPALPPAQWWFGGLCCAGFLLWSLFVAWTVVAEAMWQHTARTACVWLMLAFAVMVTASVLCAVWALLLLPGRRDRTGDRGR